MQKLFVVGLVIAAMSAALSVPTLLGVSGGYQVQDASIQQGMSLTGTTDDEWDFNIPLTQFLVGVTPNLELGAFAYSWTGSETLWGISGKLALPYMPANGKLAIGAMYNNQDGDTEWAGTLSGTWPVFTSSEFTGAVVFSDLDGDNATTFMAALVKMYENGARLGFEYSIDTPGFLDWFNYQDEASYGTVYYTFPLQENLSGRVAFSGIGDDYGIVGKFTLSGNF
ncbi:MAG: hypothetical protein ACYC7E_18820 [Armatimonadota bacterium]